MIHLEHSPLGGSAAFRFMNCYGSFLLHREEIEAGTFEAVDSEFARLGVGAHELGAKAIATGQEPYEFLGEEFNGYLAGWPDGIKLDAVQVYFNECMRILANRRGDQGHMLLEETIHLPEIHPLFKGTVDFGWWNLTQGVFLRDYKNGEGVGVAAPNNRQLLYYGALMIMKYPALRSAPRTLPVSLGIVQPNFYGIFEEPDIWTTTLGYVVDWLHGELLPIMNSLTARHGYTDDDFVLGEHCQFCPVLLECPKMQAAFETIANASEDFVTMLSNAELDHYYSQREYAKRFLKRLEEVVFARKITGGDIPSAKLVNKQIARVWKPGAEAAIKAKFGEKAYKPAELLSPAGIEKLSSEGKAMALEYGYKPDSDTLTIAPLSDRRPEAKPRTNETVFAQHAGDANAEGW